MTKRRLFGRVAILVVGAAYALAGCAEDDTADDASNAGGAGMPDAGSGGSAGSRAGNGGSAGTRGGTGGSAGSRAGSGGKANAGAPGAGTSGDGSGGGSGENTGATGGTSGTSNEGGAPSGTSGASGDGSAGSAGSSGSPSTACDDPGLVWRTANKTNYTSYPDPNSEECIEYNGCMWAGQFAACDEKKPENWVAAHDIVAAFPDFDDLELHDLCLRKGTKTLVVTVLDTCGDGDCDGCCTRNQGSADQLIDIESYTNERWGVPDGPIEWADLGPTRGSGCD